MSKEARFTLTTVIILSTCTIIAYLVALHKANWFALLGLVVCAMAMGCFIGSYIMLSRIENAERDWVKTRMELAKELWEEIDG